MSSNPVCALIIGVSDYSAFDPSGRADLPGAVNDARRWYRYATRSLGVPKTQVRVQSDTQGHAPTDRAAVIAGLQWLGRQLGNGTAHSALFTFSGHGLTVDSDANASLEEGLSLALAPSDIAPDLQAALTFEHIEKILFDAIADAKYGADATLSADEERVVLDLMENITSIVDACYTQPEVSDGTLRALTSGPVPDLPTPPPRIFSRLILACQLWETAYEIQSADLWHGAFSFALQTMLEQWATGTDDQTDVHYVRATYGDAVFRTRQLVNTLGLDDQNPTLLGSATNLALLPVLRPGTQVAQGRTSVSPDGLRKREEFSAGQGDAIVSVQIMVGSNTLAMCLVVGAAQVPGDYAQFSSNTEYWAWNLITAKNYNTSSPPTMSLIQNAYTSWDDVPEELINEFNGLTEIIALSAGNYGFPNVTAGMPLSANSPPAYQSNTYNFSNPNWGFQAAWDTTTGANTFCRVYWLQGAGDPVSMSPGIVLSNSTTSPGNNVSTPINNNVTPWVCMTFA